MCLFLSLIFYIIRKKNALETTKKVSCSIIYFLMFTKSKFYCNFSHCFCFSLWEWASDWRIEDGCNSGYCFGASESFVSKISVFFEYDVLLVYVLKRFRPGIQQVYKDFWGYCVRVFFLKTHKVKILLIIPDHFFFVPLQKNLLLSIIPLSEVHWLFAQA